MTADVACRAPNLNDSAFKGRTLLLVSPTGWPYPHFDRAVRSLGGRLDRFLLSYSMGRPDWGDGGRSNAVRNQMLRDHVAGLEEPPLMALFITYDDCLEVETLRFLRRRGIPTVCLHVDMAEQWYRILRTGPYFDLVACAQKMNIGSLRRYSIRAEFIPMGASPRDVPLSETTEGSVCYVGSPQPYRLWMLERLAQRFPVAAWGKWFPAAEEKPGPRPDQCGPQPDDPLHQKTKGLSGQAAKALFDARYLFPILRYSPHLVPNRLYGRRAAPWRDMRPDALRGIWRGQLAEADLALPFAGSRLNMGFTYFSGKPGTAGEVRQCRLREFEGPLYSANGACLLQRFPELDDLYEADEEVVTWDSFEELCSKIGDLMDDEGRCREIGRRGREAVLCRHLWSHRLQEMVSWLC